MKRLLIPFFLLLILVLPVSAEDFSNKEIINLSDYFAINGNNEVYNTEIDLYDVPDELKSIPVYGIDIVYRVVYGESPPSANFFSAEGDIFLEYHTLGNGLFRMIGRSDTPANLQDAFIEFEADGDFGLYIYQLNVDIVDNFINDSINGGLVSTSTGEFFGYNGDYTHEDIYPGSEAPDPESEYYITTFDTYVFPQKWYLFDEYHFTFSTESLGIVEVVAELTSGEILPVSISYYNPDTSNANSVSIIVSVDLSGCDRNMDTSLRITIKSRYYLYQHNFITITDPKGTVNSQPNFFTVWFNRIFQSISNLVDGNSNQVKDSNKYEDKVAEQEELLGDLTTDLNSVERPDIGNIELSPVGMVDTSVVTLTTTGISTALGNEILIRVLLIALTFALAGFILYGKK